MFFLATTVLFALWCLRLMAVNDRLRKRSVSDVMWEQFEKRQLRDPRHPSSL